MHFWIDIDADRCATKKLRTWLQGLNLPDFVVETLSEPAESWASQVIPLQRACLAVIRILPYHKESDEMAHMAFLSLRNLLITFNNDVRHEGESLFIPALQKMQEPGRISGTTSSAALIAWLRFHLDRTSRALRDLRYAVLTMDEAMDQNINAVKLPEIISAKDELLRLLSVAEEQSECLQSLSIVAPEIDGTGFSTIKGSLDSLNATASATERMALRLEKHILDLRQRSEQHDQSVMNRRLAVLTVLSAIFLPLTLLTGIWGMNFAQMPELSKPYAYPLALVFMFTVASSMIFYFRRSGWFE